MDILLALASPRGFGQSLLKFHLMLLATLVCSSCIWAQGDPEGRSIRIAVHMKHGRKDVEGAAQIALGAGKLIGCEKGGKQFCDLPVAWKL